MTTLSCIAALPWSVLTLMAFSSLAGAALMLFALMAAAFVSAIAGGEKHQ